MQVVSKIRSKVILYVCRKTILFFPQYHINMSDPLSLAAIIDDDEIHTFVIKSLMNNCQFAQQIISFSSGIKALEFFSAYQDSAAQLPDVVILDIEMPFMDGWEFLDEFKKIKEKLCKKIPIFILTTSISNQDRKKAASHPEVTGYIVKPLKKEDLTHIAKEVSI